MTKSKLITIGPLNFSDNRLCIIMIVVAIADDNRTENICDGFAIYRHLANNIICIILFKRIEGMRVLKVNGKIERQSSGKMKDNLMLTLFNAIK